jgi:hypothetical protein
MRRARDGDHARFQGLAQHLQGLPAPFRQLVEEQHAVVRERDFAGTRIGPAADQRRRARPVVRRAKRARAPRRRIEAASAD